MKNELTVQEKSYNFLEIIRSSYHTLLDSHISYSLLTLLNSDQFDLEAYCKNFRPHASGDQVIQKVETFGKQYGIWTKSSAYNISCASFLYPSAEPARLGTIMKNMLIDFTLNDIMGRDTFTQNTLQEHLSRTIIENMSGIDESLNIDPEAKTIEYANAETLQKFKDTSPANWFTRFLKLYGRHISITHQNLNTEYLGYIPSVPEYIDMRNNVSGMNHVILWFEYNNNQFLNWELCDTLKISQNLQNLQWLAASFGSLSNDLFSWEKEVIDNGADSNIVMIIALNNPDLPLIDCLLKAVDIVRNLLIKFSASLYSLRSKIKELSITPVEKTTLETHLTGLEDCVKASWSWQAYTRRYKRAKSVWSEIASI